GQLQHTHTCEQAEVTGDEGEGERLLHDLPGDVAWRGTDASTDADLLGPFLDAHQHDVADADHPGDQRADAHEPAEPADADEQAVHHAIELLHVPAAESI